MFTWATLGGEIPVCSPAVITIILEYRPATRRHEVDPFHTHLTCSILFANPIAANQHHPTIPATSSSVLEMMAHLMFIKMENKH